tara:strand:+ start:551 stop:2548 length:1998 start_codon:yes stop_codon:yes gene_type:complete
MDIAVPALAAAHRRASGVGKLVLGGIVVVAFAIFAVPIIASVVERSEMHECPFNPTADPLDLQSTLASVVYLVGCFWIFFGIAMVCEEYFVMALQVLIDRLEVSPDVAGATFMAAGSSSPEVFAALMGIFRDEENEDGTPDHEEAGGAGLATVAGSCIFNMLVIVGASVLIGGSEIQMDWRPVLREVVFHLAAVLTMLWVFADGVLTPLEAWFMVLLYAMYVLVNGLWGRIVQSVCPREAAVEKQLLGGGGGELKRQSTLSTAEMNVQKILSQAVKQKQFVLMHERHKVVEALFGGPTHTLRVPEAERAQIEEAFNLFDHDKSGALDLAELQRMLDTLEVFVPADDVAGLFRILDSDGDGHVTLDEFVPTFWIWKKCGMHSELDEAREAEIKAKFRELDANADGHLDGRELVAGIRHLTSDARNELQLLKIFENAGIDVDRGMPLGEFKRLYLLWVGEHNELDEVVHGVHSPFEWPRHAPLLGKLLFVVGWPFALCFHLTIPNSHGHRHAFVWVAMAASIAWLGLLVFFMIAWAEKAGCLLGISSTFMGLTFCAAGTSAPDAIASILVARAGQGDMAVSNAFGSNIFNILFGMGVPFVIKTSINEASFEVATDGLLDSGMILIVLLALYVALLLLGRMRVTRMAAILFLVLYAAYVLKCIVEEVS